MTPVDQPRGSRRLAAVLALVALVGGAVAATRPADAGSSSRAAAAPTAGPVGPTAPAMDSVTWDEDGDSGDDDALGPSGGAEYATSGQVWERTELTYGFDTWTPDLTVAQQKAALAAVFDQWAAVTPLTFTAVPDCGLPFNHSACTTPDIRIVFGSGDHGAGASDPNFDGPGGVVGHAYGPAPDSWNFTAAGDVHLDDAETWRINGASPDLQTVALHETGHALGLAHTSAGCSNPPGPSRPIMCSVLTGVQRVLGADDIAGIQSLYGQPPPDLPDGIDVEIMVPGAGGAEGAANDHMVQITNGYDDDLQGASLDVAGVPDCDRPTLSVPANTITYSVCTIDPASYLVGMDTSESVTMTATLSASGLPDTSDGPIAIDVVADDHPFSDVPAWVDHAVDWIYYWGLADGYPGNKYKPANPITRNEVTRMMWRYAGEPSVGAPHPFTDVLPWVEAAVDWAAFDPAGPTEPLMAGFPDDTFRGTDPMTRAEVVRLLYRYVGSPPVTGLPDHGFSDVPPWVEDAVTWAAYDPDGAGPLESVIGGFGDGTFRPEDQITRAQLTRALFRLTDQLVD